MIGAITNSGPGSGTVTLSGGIGANVTAIIENSTNSPLTVSTTALTVNSGGTTLANLNSSGTKVLTVSANVGGTGDLILSNNSAIADGITISSIVTNIERFSSSLGPGCPHPGDVGEADRRRPG